MPTLHTTHPHTTTFPNPLKLHSGAKVIVEDRPTTYPGWLWCRAEDGVEGWVPAEILERDGDRGTLRRDYDATELTVAAGETLELIEKVAGWAFCRTSSGQVGWVPLEKTREVQ